MHSVGIRLYLPDAEMNQRIDAARLAAYINALERQLVGTCILHDMSGAKGMLIAIAVKPHKISRVWCEVLEGDLPAELVADIEGDMQAIPAPELSAGPIAFAFHIQIQEDTSVDFPEMPRAWLTAKNRGEILDQWFAELWPD